MTTPAIISTPNGILHKDNSILFAGRLKGGLKFNAGAYCEIDAVPGLDPSYPGLLAIIMKSSGNFSGTNILKYRRGDQALIMYAQFRSTLPRFEFKLYDGSSYVTAVIYNTNLYSNNRATNRYFLGTKYTAGTNSAKFSHRYDYSMFSGSSGATLDTSSFSLPSDEKLILGPFPVETVVMGLISAAGAGINNTTEFVPLREHEMQRTKLDTIGNVNYLYHFDSQEGTTLYDRSGNGHHMTLHNFTNTTKGHPDNAWVDAYTLEPK